MLLKYTCNNLKFLYCLLLLLPFNGSAQEKINISGIVLDALSLETLPGATIRAESIGQSEISDQNGAFRFSVSSGKPLLLRFFMAGYQSDSLLLSPAAAGAPLRILLRPSQQVLEQVEITGKAEGQIRAMLDMKKAESIKNIVSAAQIATFPDMNAAEVMQRIPGITLQRDQGEGRYVQLRGTPPQLTTFNINGEQIPSPEGGVRFVGMDIIPADQIDFIEVSKVMTPDMDADGIGGSVNVKTKEAAGAKPDIRATFSGGYSHLRQSPNYQMQYTYGQRFGRFGFNMNSSFYQNIRGADNIEYDFAKGPFFGSQGAGVENYFVQFREVQLRHYDLTRTRISVAPTFDFRFNKNSYLYLRAMYNRFTDDETRRRKIYELDDALSYDYYLYGGIVHDVRTRNKQQELNTISLGGEHQIGRLKLDYQLFAAFARESVPDHFEASFESAGQAIAIKFNFDDPNFPRAEYPNANNAGNATAYDKFQLDELLLEERVVRDVNLTPRFNLTLPYTFNARHKGYVKFGGKLRAKNKERDIRSQQFAAYFTQPLGYPGVGPALNLTTVNDGFREDNLLNKGYLLEYMPSAAMLKDFYEFYPQHFVFDRTATRTQSFGEDYEARERIYAAYGMIRHDAGPLMLIGGLRFERTDIDYTGARILLDGNRFVGIDTLTDQRTHQFWLPQLQLRYAINDNFNLRAAATYTYSRPNFDDVLPYREQDREEVKFGNPDLRYPRAVNFDLLAERYFRSGLLQAGVFYKQLDDFIFFFKRFAHEGDPADFSLVEITKAINGKRANVYGAELQAQSKFGFFPGFLKNFGIYANYTYTASTAKINKRFPANFTDAVVVFGEDDLEVFASGAETEQVTLPGQARHTANLALFYDTPKFFARLTANYHDAFLYQLGADKDLDEYYDQEFRLDFTANYNLGPKVNVFIDLINLTNTPLRYYLGNTDRVKLQEFYSWWGRAGIKFDF